LHLTAPELKIHLTCQGLPLYNGRTRTNGKIPQGLPLAPPKRAPKLIIIKNRQVTK